MADVKLALDLTATPLMDAKLATRTLVEAGYLFFTLAEVGDNETTRRNLGEFNRSSQHLNGGEVWDVQRVGVQLKLVGR